jgi:hypothetical protein
LAQRRRRRLRKRRRRRIKMFSKLVYIRPNIEKKERKEKSNSRF